MGFVIVSTGALARSRLRTLRSESLAIAAGAALLAVLGVGVALGFRLARFNTAASPVESNEADPSVAWDPQRPESRAVIDRLGALSGRLIRLESETVRLGRRLGLSQPPDESLPGATSGRRGTATTPAAAEPRGGPLLDPVARLSGAVRRGTGNDFIGVLQRLGDDLSRIEARLAEVAEATSLQDLDDMAFPSRPPINGVRISSGFGNRRDPFTNRLARHTGVDMPAPSGAPILASAGGRVRFAGHYGAYGRSVEIDHGNGLVTRYGHASKLFVRSGDLVLPGQRIASVGSSGRSTGPHLHFEVIRNGAPVEPRLYLARSVP